MQYLGFLPDRARHAATLLTALSAFVELYLIRGYPLTYATAPNAATPDGYEALFDCLCDLLPCCSPAPRLRAAAPTDVALLQLCYHGLDQLAGLPCLFGDLVRYYTALARCGEEDALCVYSLLQEVRSPLLSQQMLLELPRSLQDAVAAQRGQLAREDEDGFEQLFRLLAALVGWPRLRPALLQSPSVDLVALTTSLLSAPLSLSLHAVLCDFLADCCADATTARAVWARFEQGCVIHQPAARGALCASLHVHSGLQRALDVEEPATRHYPLTLAFLRLLDTLVARLPAELLLGSHALYAFLSFTVHDVLLKYAQRPAEDPEEPACMLCRALAVLTRCVQTLADSVATLSPDRLRASCVLSLVAELLSASPLTERVLAVQAVPLSLCPQRAPAARPLCPASFTSTTSTVSTASTTSTAIASTTSTVSTTSTAWASWSGAAVEQALRLVLALLQFSAPTIAALRIQRPLAGGQSLVTPLAQQLLARPEPTLAMLLHVADASPALQRAALEVLYQLALQNPPAAFFSFFDACPAELGVLRACCTQILRSALLPARPAPETEACALRLLELLRCHGSAVVAFLLDLDGVLRDDGLAPGCLLEALLQFLSTPHQIQRHPRLAAASVRALFGCCSHPVPASARLLDCLVRRGVLGFLASAAPFFLQHYATHAQPAAEQAALLEFVFYAVKTLGAALFALQKSENADAVAVVLTRLFEYDPAVVACFTNASRRDSAPIMDAVEAMRWFGDAAPALSEALAAMQVKKVTATVWGSAYECVDVACVDEAVHPFCVNNHVANEAALRASLEKECEEVRSRRCNHP